MRRMAKVSSKVLSQGMDGVFKGGIVLSSLFIAFMMVSTVFATFMRYRYALGQAQAWTIHINGYLLLATCFLGLAYAQRQGRHIRVDILLQRLPYRAKYSVASESHALDI